jgi:hypothetical protein
MGMFKTHKKLALSILSRRRDSDVEGDEWRAWA